MNAEAANDVDPKYYLNPRTIVSIQVRVGDVWVGVVWACILTFVWSWGKMHVGEWCCEVVGSCKVQLSCEVRSSTSSQPDKNLYACIRVCGAFVMWVCLLASVSLYMCMFVCLWLCVLVCVSVCVLELQEASFQVLDLTQDTKVLHTFVIRHWMMLDSGWSDVLLAVQSTVRGAFKKFVDQRS